jgi:hypothetical protein
MAIQSGTHLGPYEILSARIIATKYKTNGNMASGVERTRPLCPYPQVAQYTGSGKRDEAANFVCKVAK